jgi:hypothetical protein
MRGNPNPDQSNLKPFKKGHDERRNVKGRPFKLPEIDQILAKVLGNDELGATEAEQILQALKDRAKKGDVRAAEVLLDRAYGKAKQAIDHTSGGEKINIPVITWAKNGD